MVIDEMPARNAKRILLLKLSSLGDIIHTLPALHSLRCGYPDAEIAWVIDNRWKDILEGNPDLTCVILLDKGGLRVPSRFFGAVKVLRSFMPDLCIDFQGLFYTGLLSYLSGAKCRIGFSSAREFSSFFYTDKFSISFEGIHAVERYMKLSEYAGGADTPPEFKLPIGTEDREYVQGLLGSDQTVPYIAIHAGTRWQTKRWLLEGFARVADYLADEYNARIILIGSREDAEYNNRMKSLMQTIPLDLAGKTNLKQLTALFEKTDLLVTNDSGPMHLASALGTPVLAIFGPTDPVRTGPYRQNQNVISQGIDCSPCFKKRCRTIICLTELPVEKVIKMADEILRDKE